jgi:hypothetical protein
MNKYAINVRRVYIEQVEIEASSEEEAKLFVAQGFGKVNPWLFEYAYDLPSTTWTVTKNPHKWDITNNKGHYPKGAPNDWKEY